MLLLLLRSPGNTAPPLITTPGAPHHVARSALGAPACAGLSLDESLLFWRTAFAPRTSSEKFQKEYAYNVRHSYGREGSRKDYEAQNCLKIIGAAPGVGEAHGCPFKTLNAAGLRAAMSRCGVKPEYASSPQRQFLRTPVAVALHQHPLRAGAQLSLAATGLGGRG